MLNIEIDILRATERRDDRRREAEQYRLTKAALSQSGQRVRLALALATRHYAVLRQTILRFLPFKTTFRQRQAAEINPS